MGQMWDKKGLTMVHCVFYNCIMEKLYLDLSKLSLLKKFKGDFFHLNLAYKEEILTISKNITLMVIVSTLMLTGN